jgi:hypothetical protein
VPGFRILLLMVLRAGALGSALFAAAVIGIEVWKHGGDMTALNPGFILLVAIVLAAGLWLARSIGRELRKPGS